MTHWRPDTQNAETRPIAAPRIGRSGTQEAGLPWSSNRVEAGEVEAGDVIEVGRVWHGGERLPVDGLQGRLVGGQVVGATRGLGAGNCRALGSAARPYLAPQHTPSMMSGAFHVSSFFSGRVVSRAAESKPNCTTRCHLRRRRQATTAGINTIHPTMRPNVYALFWGSRAMSCFFSYLPELLLVLIVVTREASGRKLGARLG